MNDNSEDNITSNNNNSNYKENTVVFNVGGRIFEIRRTLLDKFPDTILARSASDLWNTSTDTDNATAVVQQSSSNGSIPTNRQPIFIDRDSIRFAFVLDYMRDNGVIELPITVTRDTFLKELVYYGFNIEDDENISCITCAIPTVEAVNHIKKLRTTFFNTTNELKLQYDISILAYACFCEFLDSGSQSIVITLQYSQEIHDYILPYYLIDANKRLQSSTISSTTLIDIMKVLWNDYFRHASTSNLIAKNLFIQSLVQYGFECTNYVYRNHTDHYHTVYIDLKTIS